jgi:hypothetical protein
VIGQRLARAAQNLVYGGNVSPAVTFGMEISQ